MNELNELEKKIYEIICQQKWEEAKYPIVFDYSRHLSKFFLEEMKETWIAGASFIPVDPSKYEQDADDYLKSKYKI